MEASLHTVSSRMERKRVYRHLGLRMNMDRISVNEVSTFSWNFLEDVVRYSTFGFGGIGVWRHKISDFCDQTVSELIRTSRLKVSSLQWVGGFTGNDGLSFAEAIEDAISAIRSASILQAGCLIVHPGSANGHTRRHARRLLVNALNELVPIAEDFGVRLALEPMHCESGAEFTFLDQIDSSLEIAAQYPAKRLGIVLDLYYFGCDLSLADDLLSNVERLALVQLADRRCAPLNEQNRSFPGEGTIALSDWIRTLEQGGYRGFYEFELLGEDLAKMDAFQMLASLAHRVPDLFAAAQVATLTVEQRAELRNKFSTLGST
jgi:sugar phosphate isomerase/epimerase